MLPPPPASLNRAQRACLYGLAGWALEVAFTGVRGALSPARQDWRLRGHSYLWMLPVYGAAAVFFEPLHDRLRRRPRWQRALVYGVGISTFEHASGTSIARLTGSVPWDYRGATPLALPGGAVRLDYVPLWALAGLALEGVHDTLRRVRLAAP